MNQIAMSFVETRCRKADPETSRNAAKAAGREKACAERIQIRQALAQQPMTAREISAATGIEYIECQRRISEVAGIEKTDATRDGCKVWRAIL